ncbi:MAG: acetyl-CoA carboxylase carboxyl transferase subunit alpha [Rickettsiales bacterium]|nr:acetyl-CoA carboxylase carboxyl transferase subunit alpha [Rickettsiales bacterium]|tara:strand:+ start:2851 stop:3810 length:960 start_codon:yes stop_codon:yes gene_type:complete
MADFVLEFERPIVDLEDTIQGLRDLAERGGIDVADQIAQLEEKASALRKEVFAELSPYQRTQISRHQQRPYTLDYVEEIFTDFQEFHGDRNFMDDQAIVGGPARFEGKPVMLVGHQKGRATRENVLRNFGMPRPEGYRKALRLMSMAERFSMPIFTFVDTPGAYPGIGAEERGQAEAIAKNILVMSRLKVPIITIIVGEGGSGGALAIAVANRVLMLENAIYSVISPEACASILWRDSTKGPVASEALKYTAPDCLRLKVVDEVIPEPLGGAHRGRDAIMGSVRAALQKHLGELSSLGPEALRQDRYDRFRSLGVVAGA